MKINHPRRLILLVPVPEKVRGNHGLYFNIRDRIMGTNHPDYEARLRDVTSRPVPAPKP